VELLGESVREILTSAPYLALVPAGDVPEAYAGGYPHRRKAAGPQQPG
jgi:hypothetical protein